MSSLPWFSGPDALHHGRYEPEGQLCGEMVVVIPVVPQRLIPMVLPTMVIPQLQFLDKVIDDSVVRVVEASPSRSHARCVQRQVPWIRSAVAALSQGRLHPCRGAEFDPHGSQTIEISLLPYTWRSMSLLRWSCGAVVEETVGQRYVIHTVSEPPPPPPHTTTTTPSLTPPSPGTCGRCVVQCPQFWEHLRRTVLSN